MQIARVGFSHYFGRKLSSRPKKSLQDFCRSWYTFNMKDLSNREYKRYENILTSITASIVRQVDGIQNDESARKYKFGRKTEKTTNIHVYFKDGNLVVIDVFLNAVFGHSIPDTVLELQERVKEEAEAMTRFKVESVNVNISNLMFN